MITTKIFRRHYVITALVLLAFVFLGMMANFAIFRLVERSTEARQPKFTPESSLARVIDTLAEALPKAPGKKANRALALKKIREANGEEFPVEMRLLDVQGRSLEDPTQAKPEGWDENKLPTAPYQIQSLIPNEPPGPPMLSLILLPGEPAEYLYLRRKFPHPGPPPGPPRGPGGPGAHPPGPALLAFVTLLASILGGAAVSLWLLFRSFREKAELADRVIAELQAGNLKARFPIDRVDELGQTMTRFNRMAEEIERLVEQLRESERTRTNLLQELAHDLRTPVASLKNLLETLESKGSTLASSLHQELTTLALREVDYFERLVEDLLVLARIGEPHYRYARAPFDLNELIEEEIESILSRRNAQGDRKIAVDFTADHTADVMGDAHLLKRMIRNALENAHDFSKSRIQVRIESIGSDAIGISVQDDGPGFSAEQLQHFGTRRLTRQLGAERGGRISIGLGSVIMRTIAEIHRGKISATNNDQGALVRFEIPGSSTLRQ